MAKSTSASTSAAEKLGARLRNLVTDATITKYEGLKSLKLEAGPPGMDAAVWLEDLVLDRRAGLVAHMKHLRLVFTGLASAVEDAAAALTGEDKDGAGAIDAINSWIDKVNDATIPSSTSKKTYNSDDGGGNPQLLWETGADGSHIGDSITIHMPKDGAGLPYQHGFDEYKDILVKAGGKASDAPGLVFTPDEQVIRPE